MSKDAATTSIMVVDDTPANLRLLREMLGGKDYRVLAFTDGQMALSAAAKNPPDLILLDIVMPGMDGFQVCERLKADDALREIPVIFVSGLAETKDKVNAFAAGGVDYVTKPFQFEEVNARVETHLQIRRERRELQHAYDTLRELEMQRDSLVHMIVHDMRSPLLAVSACIELWLEGDVQLSKEQQEFQVMGQHACDELVGMVSSLLDVSRMEAGEMPLDKHTWDILAIAEAASESVAALAKRQALTVDVGGESIRVVVDRDLVHRVLVNLLGNAIKYSPRLAAIDVRIVSTATTARVTVTDRGPGIAAEFHARIFQKFGQVESRASGPKHSTGLGLTFCKLAVEAHGGRIGVESQAGQGSTFWIELPTAGSDDPLDAEPPSDHSMARSHETASRLAPSS